MNGVSKLVGDCRPGLAEVCRPELEAICSVVYYYFTIAQNKVLKSYVFAITSHRLLLGCVFLMCFSAKKEIA